MKTIKRIILIVVLGLIISSVVHVDIDDFFFNTIFTVSSIMFSIGLGLIVTFNYNGVSNMDYVFILRKNIREVRDSYIFWFSISTFLYLIEKYFHESCFLIKLTTTTTLTLCPSISIAIVILFSLIYYILNFLKIQKLGEDIFDRINKGN